MSDKQATDYIFGTIFSAKGVKPDPIKIQALQDLPIPQTTVIPGTCKLFATIPS